MPWLTRRAYRQRADFLETVKVEVKDDGLYFTRKTGQGLIPWSYVRKWRHNKKLIMLYPGREIFYMLPSHFFATNADYQTVIAMIEDKLGKAR
jgi:hypothetical protein